MDLDKETKHAVHELGEAINSAIGESLRIKQAIERLHDLGYNPNLMLKLEIGLQNNEKSLDEEFPEDVVLDLTEEDLRTLQSMRIKLDDEK
jgi:hypothetical protein